jgi:hypothetical protein
MSGFQKKLPARFQGNRDVGTGEEKKYIAVRLSADSLDFSGCDGAAPPRPPENGPKH